MPLVLFLCVSSVWAVGSDDERSFKFSQSLGAGINAYSYDPYWKTGVRRISDSHLDKARRLGFKTIRVNLMAFQFMDPGSLVLDSIWLSRLDALIQVLLRKGFSVIIDEHDFEACRENVFDCERRLVAFWSQIAPRYAQLPASVVFEVLNEPSRSITPNVWNEIFSKVLAVIRSSNPSRYVVVGPANFNNLNALSTLVLPESDRNLLVTIHYYEPLEFSHQRFPSGKWFPTLPVRGWGAEIDRQKVVADFARAQEWAKVHRRPIFLGEFGSYEEAPLVDRGLYAGYVARTAERFGFSWVYWQFDKSFALYDFKKDDWIYEIANPLFAK